MKKRIGIVLMIISAVLILIALLLKPVIIPLFKGESMLPNGCQNIGRKGNQAPLSKEEEVERQHEADQREYEKTNIDYTGKNIAFEHAGNVRFSKYEKGIVGVTETTLVKYSKSGKKEWSVNVQHLSPVLKVSDKYILIFEKDGNKFSVYDGERNILSKNVGGKIKTGSISSGGDSVIVYERDGYKGSVLVCNKSGEEAYLWNSGKYGILDADVSKSRKLAVSLLNTESAVESKIYFFDMGKEGVENSVNINESIAFDIEFNDNLLNVFTDNRIIGYNDRCEHKWNYDAKSKSVITYNMDEKGMKAVVFDKDNASQITLITSGGEEKGNIKTDVMPDLVDVLDKRVLYNEGRVLMVTSLAGEVVARYTCSRDIKKAYFIDKDNIFIVYGSSIEFLDINGG